MDEPISFVKLNCLNCGASLKITQSIFEFACQYCGASQIVERGGGTIALKMLSARIERIEDSVRKTSAEIQLQKNIKELQKLEEKREKFFQKTEDVDFSTTPFVALAMGAAILVAGYFAIQLDSAFPVILAIIVVVVIYFCWKKKLNVKDAQVGEVLKSYDQKIAKLKAEITDLEEITKT